MQSWEPEVRSAINSIYDELVGNGTTGPAPQEPPAASGNPRSQHENVMAAAARKTSKETHAVIAGHAGTTEAKPVRGVVLEFATRM
jgi:hypothetical protein